MPATSPPVALLLAAATIMSLILAALMLAAPSPALAERWLRPVPGEVARAFAYDRAAPFAAGAHRGADLAAPAGTPVRAVCSGRVVHAGAIARLGGVVSVRCGARRVSYLPLVRIAARTGATIRAGAAVGVVGTGHSGLHIGVRREGDRFAYEDPLALLRDAPAPPARPMIIRRPRPRRVGPRPEVPRPIASRRLARRVTPLDPARFSSWRPGGDLAPWPVWLGLTLLLSGAAGSGTIVIRRRALTASRPLTTGARSTR